MGSYRAARLFSTLITPQRTADVVVVGAGIMVRIRVTQPSTCLPLCRTSPPSADADMVAGGGEAEPTNAEGCS